MFKFAQRIVASLEPEGHEVDAVTYKQFMEWDQKEKDQYLKEHPKSSFRHKIKKEQPSGTPGERQAPKRFEQKPKRTDEEFMDEWNKDNRRPEETQTQRKEGTKERKGESSGDKDYASTAVLKRAGPTIRTLPTSIQKRLRSAKNLDEMIAQTPAGPGASRWLPSAGGLIGADLTPEQHKEIQNASDALRKAYSEHHLAVRDREGEEVTDSLFEEFEQRAAEAANLLEQFTGSKRIRRIDPLKVMQLSEGATKATPKS
jgi:hypothetical protein